MNFFNPNLVNPLAKKMNRIRGASHAVWTAEAAGIGSTVPFKAEISGDCLLAY